MASQELARVLALREVPQMRQRPDATPGAPALSRYFK